jgi:hypothetical protein
VTHIVRAFPVVAPVEELEGFLAELAGARRADTQAFYRRYGISHESAYVQQTAHGPIVIVVTVLDEDHQQAAARYQATTAGFEEWFKGNIRRLTGVDPDRQPLGPPSATVFAFDGRSGEVRAGTSRAGL